MKKLIIALLLILFGIIAISAYVIVSNNTEEVQNNTAQDMVTENELQSEDELTASIPENNKNELKEEENPPPIEVDLERTNALNYIEFVRSMLQCQYDLDKKYPESLSGIEAECFPGIEVSPPEIMKDSYANTLNYFSSNQGQSYYFEVTVRVGEGYEVTEKGLKYIVIPKETQEKYIESSRDSERVRDLGSIQMRIERETLSQFGTQNVLCAGQETCFGDSRDPNSEKTDGTGWVKINFETNDYRVEELPIDPINNDTNHYIYCADSNGWMIAGVLESAADSKMQNDDGTNPDMYEIGTNTDLLTNATFCRYH